MSGMSVKTRLICTIVMFGLASLVSTNSTAQSVTCTYTSSEAANTGPGSGAYGINRFDATVGTWADTSFNAHGFYRSPQGKIVRFSIPKAVNTYPQGINDRGTIVGYFQNVSDNGSANGFKIGDGEVSHITYPGATYTEPHGINKKGDIVGWYALPNSPGAGFRLSGGQFSSFLLSGRVRYRGLGDQQIRRNCRHVGGFEHQPIRVHLQPRPVSECLVSRFDRDLTHWSK